MVNKFRGIPILEKIDKVVFNDLINHKKILYRSFYIGSTIHEQLSSCSGLDVLLSGKLVAYSLSSNGSETIVFEFNKGSIIGANLLFGEQNKYPMNIYCTSDSELLHIPKKILKELLREYDFAMEFIKCLSLNSQGMNKKIAMYTQKSLRENLLDYLSALATQQNSNIITLPISKKQLADYLGVQRPSLFRELKKMKDEGLIEVNNREIIVFPIQRSL